MHTEPTPPPSGAGATFAVALLSIAVLVLTADYQIYDNNFYALSEATALLAGEHPYRDFFEWGIPLQAYLSLAAQYLSGQRLIGEFVLQWLFIVAGMIVAFRLALRLSRSPGASLAAMLPALLLLAASPTYQYPKVFVYPCALLIAYRYIDRPNAWRSLAMGLVTGVAFLFRHDHGIYVGIVVGLAFALAVHANADLRRPSVAVRQLGACAVGCILLLLPWAIVVARSEGLVDYVEARAYINTAWSVHRPVFAPVLDINPVRALTPDRAAPADAEPYEWLLANWLPGRSNAEAWLYQMTVLVILATVISGGLAYVLYWVRRIPIRQDSNYALLAGVLLLIVARQLFREQSYFVMAAATAAACGARFLGPTPGATAAGLRRVWYGSRRSLAVVLLAITVATAVGYSRESNLPQPIYQAQHLPDTFARLTAFPPIDGRIPAETALAVTAAEWKRLDEGRKSDVMLRYVSDCSAPGDHLLVSGPTPYHVGYYARRPVAGGHLYWHDGWRSDSMREAQSLALLQKQSVPFALSTDRNVLDDLQPYPRIRAYVAEHYVEIPGTHGRVLMDKRSVPVRRFGRLRLSCFH